MALSADGLSERGCDLVRHPSRPCAARCARRRRALVGAQVDDRRRRARQLAAVEHEVGAARGSARGRPPAAWRVGPPAPVGAGLQHRPAHGAERRRGRPASAGTRRPSVSGRARTRAGSGWPGWAAAASRRRGAARSSATRVRAAELGQRGERELEGEEHDRGGLVGPAALERVEPLDGLRELGVAGEAVDGVGREHARRRRRPCSARTSRPRAASIIARPTITRSMPGEVAPALDGRASRPRAAARRPRRPARRRPRARRNGAAAPRPRATRRADDVEAVGAGEQRAGAARGAAISGASARARRRRRAGWRGRRRPSGHGGEQVRRGRTPRRGRAAAALARATRQRVPLTSVPGTSRSGRSCLSASAIAPLPVPTSSTRAPSRQRRGRPPRAARSPAAGSATRGSTARSIEPEALACRAM